MVRRRSAALAACGLLLLGGGCDPGGHAPFTLAGVEGKTPVPQDTVQYSDTDEFDRMLAAALRAGHPQVSVTVGGTVMADALPPRLARWLTAVQRYGGTVEGRRIAADGEDEAASELVQLLVDMATELVRYVVSVARYKAAADYNCVVSYVAETRNVRRLMFSRR